ncbi:MAG: hypothetical protein CM15mV34_1760 [Caudoviricetes sp.]|nr:MAG: hypothetical protein CM15mV34_1760 [Caudoviricetes sp.]
MATRKSSITGVFIWMKKPIYLVEYQKAFGAGMHPFTKTFSDIKEAQWFERAMKRSNFITKLLTVTE